MFFTKKEFVHTWNEYIKHILLWTMVFVGVLSFMLGLSAPFKTGGPDNCKPNSIQEYANIPYRLGCEFTKKRWED